MVCFFCWADESTEAFLKSYLVEVRAFVVVATIGLFGGAIASSMNLYEAAQPPKSIVGMKIENLIEGRQPTPGWYYLTKEGSPACADAEKWLKADPKPITKIPECNDRVNTECWNEDQSIGVPTLIKVEKGVISREIVGLITEQWRDAIRNDSLPLF